MIVEIWILIMKFVVLNWLEGTRGNLIFEFSNLFLTIYLSLSCWNTRSSSAIHWCGWIGHCVHSAVVFNYRVEIRMFHGLHSCQSLLVIIPKESILVNYISKNMYVFWNIFDHKFPRSKISLFLLRNKVVEITSLNIISN